MNLKNKIFNFFSRNELKKELREEFGPKIEESVEVNVNLKSLELKAEFNKILKESLEEVKTELTEYIDEKTKIVNPEEKQPAEKIDLKKPDLKSELHEVIENQSYVLYYIDKNNNVMINCNIVPGEETSFSKMMYEINSGDYEDSFIKLCPNQIVIGAYLDYINLEEDPVIQPFQAFQGKR